MTICKDVQAVSRDSQKLRVVLDQQSNHFLKATCTQPSNTTQYQYTRVELVRVNIKCTHALA